MKIYTSYFAQLRNFPRNLIGLSTAYWNPKWLKHEPEGIIWIDCPPFKPGVECEGLCSGNCNPPHPNNCEFLKTYRKQLDKLDCKIIVAKLELLTQQICEQEHFSEVNFAFLVYEAPTNKCSERWPIQQWFQDNGINIREWNKNEQ